MVNSVGLGLSASLYENRWALACVGAAAIVAAVAYAVFTRLREAGASGTSKTSAKLIPTDAVNSTLAVLGRERAVPEPVNLDADLKLIPAEALEDLGLNLERKSIGTQVTLRTVAEAVIKAINHLVSERKLQSGQDLVLNLSLPFTRDDGSSCPVCAELARYRWYTDDKEAVDAITFLRDKSSSHINTARNMLERDKGNFWIPVIVQALVQKGHIHAGVQSDWWEVPNLAPKLSYNMFLTR